MQNDRAQIGDFMLDLIQKIVENTMRNSDLTDLVVGTVTVAPPELEIKLLDSSLPPLKKQALLLTRSVVEQFVTIYQHDHDLTNTHTHGMAASTSIDSTAVTIDDDTHTHTSTSHSHGIPPLNVRDSQGGGSSTDPGTTDDTAITIDSNTHNHTSPPHSHGATTTITEGGAVGRTRPEYVPMDFTVHGKVLKVRPGVIDGEPEIMWIREELKVGEKVLLLSIQHGQRYIILTRVYDMYGT